MAILRLMRVGGAAHSMTGAAVRTDWCAIGATVGAKAMDADERESAIVGTEDNYDRISRGALVTADFGTALGPSLAWLVRPAPPCADSARERESSCPRPT